MTKPHDTLYCLSLNCGRGSMVELELPKLVTRVRFPSPAPQDSLTALIPFGIRAVFVNVPGTPHPHLSCGEIRTVFGFYGPCSPYFTATICKVGF